MPSIHLLALLTFHMNQLKIIRFITVFFVEFIPLCTLCECSTGGCESQVLVGAAFNLFHSVFRHRVQLISMLLLLCFLLSGSSFYFFFFFFPYLSFFFEKFFVFCSSACLYKCLCFRHIFLKKCFGFIARFLLNKLC